MDRLYRQKELAKQQNFDQCFKEENFNSDYLFNNLPKQNDNRMRLTVNRNELIKRKAQIKNPEQQARFSLVVMKNKREIHTDRKYDIRNIDHSEF